MNSKQTLKDVAEGRWSDIAILGLEDAEVVFWHGISDYQGSCEYIVRVGSSWRGYQYIAFGWSYGSCGGCDGYEDMGTDELIKEFVNGRVSYSKDTLRNYGNMLLAENPEPDEDRYWGADGHAKALAILAEVNKPNDD